MIEGVYKGGLGIGDEYEYEFVEMRNVYRLFR